MKILFLVFSFYIFCYSQEEPASISNYPENFFSPTNENVVKQDEILVVYRDSSSSFDTLSMHIKNYYIAQRGIPEINTIGLDLPNSVTIDNHLIELIFEGEIIFDQDWEYPNTDHVWRYFKTYIMEPIQNYLDSTYSDGQQLKSKIKYIVLCKGIVMLQKEKEFLKFV